MFEVFMRNGAYRVDYLNSEMFGTPQSLVIYVSGSLSVGRPYSRAAKRCLLTGLMMIREMNQLASLVAVYIDTAESDSSNRPALAQLRQDGAAGVFRRLLIVCEERVEKIHLMGQDWQKSLGDLSDCEILVADFERVWLIKRAKASFLGLSGIESDPVVILE
ncbi:MAG: hypothetical protein ACOYXO_19705 [Chloroflexota bacterium]